MVKNYDQIRFFLFVNSYSGKKISSRLKEELEGEKLTGVIKRLANVLDFKYHQIADFVIFGLRPIPPYHRLPTSLKIYLEIEKELVKLSGEKLDEYSTALEDYQRQLLYPAIERAVGNFLENIEDDKKFQKLLEEEIKSATNTYYKVAYKYKLPTLRIVPFIMRIIF